MAASVWMKSSALELFNCRPIALTMPIVTVWLRPNGLPIASTTSPGRNWLGSAMWITGKLLASIFSTARSVSRSEPTSRALAMRPS